MSHRLLLIGLACVLLAGFLPASSQAVGKYCLVYWRELAYYENACPPGMHNLFIRVVDSSGNPLDGKVIRQTSGAYVATTGSGGYAGYVDVPLYSSSVDLTVSDPPNLSDATPVFQENRPPRGGHYSWEVLFMYFPDVSNAPAFDINYDGGLNQSAYYDWYCHFDAPRTRSLAYYSTDPNYQCSDSFIGGGLAGTIGQTFVATGDRIVAANAKINDANWVQYQARIREGGPGGAQIGPTRTSISLYQDYQKGVVTWGINDVPVTPGNTYYLEITRAGGGNIACYYCANNYANGNYYEGGVAYSGRDLMGIVAQAYVGYGNKGRISGYVRNTGGSPIAGAVVTTSPGGYNAVSAYDGRYTIFDVPAGTYQVTAQAGGYADVTLKQRVVGAGQTKIVDFKLTAVSNLLTNPGFESGPSCGAAPPGWNLYSGSWQCYGTHSLSCFTQAVSRTGTYYGGKILAGNQNLNFVAYQTVTVPAGFQYKVGGYCETDSWKGSGRQYEYPNDVFARIGTDPSASPDPWGNSTAWSDPAYPFMRYRELSVKKIATGPQMTILLHCACNTGISTDWRKGQWDDCYLSRAVPAVVIDVEPSAADVRAASATIRWATNVPSDSQVEYGLTTSYGLSVADASLITDHSVVLPNLIPGTEYHFRVKSTAGGYDGDVSGDGTFTTANTGTIGVLKSNYADGSYVELPFEVATAPTGVVPGAFYVEEQDRSAGVRVLSTASVALGDGVICLGTLGTLNGERVLNASTVEVVSSGNAPADVVGLTNRAVVEGLTGKGLLIKTWGRVLATGSGDFTVSDGSAAPLKVRCGTLVQPNPGDYVLVTGVCGAVPGGEIVVWPRTQVDIVVL